MPTNSELTIVEQVAERIATLRGVRVILDRDLAALYEVPTSALNQAVKRNLDRFPDDFMFALSKEEQEQLAQSQLRLRKMRFSRTTPRAFTEHGAITSVLNSPRAVEASVFVVRAFVKLRQFLATHQELARKLVELERKLGDHDEAIAAIMSAIKQLMEPPPAPPKRRIGFR
jgi:hypothetical protein